MHANDPCTVRPLTFTIDCKFEGVNVRNQLQVKQCEMCVASALCRSHAGMRKYAFDCAAGGFDAEDEHERNENNVLNKKVKKQERKELAFTRSQYKR